MTGYWLVPLSIVKFSTGMRSEETCDGCDVIKLRRCDCDCLGEFL